MEIRDMIAMEIGHSRLALIESAKKSDAVNAAALKAYQTLADLIRSEQGLDAVKVMEADPDFARWYKSEYSDKKP